MNRIKNHFFSVATIFCGLLVASATQTSAQTEVPRSDWTAGVSLPSYVKMYVYVPSKVAAHPPIIVSNHACQSSVSGQINANKKIKAAADKYGYIMIFPDNQGQNCWDVGSQKAMTRDGGGDPHAVAQMVKYALKKYSGDSSRVYVMGGSSGGMMTQALLGIYPDIFVAGAPRAGVPCGCWAEGYASSNQWSGSCANGSVNKTAEQWGNYVRAINPDYKGHRPRVQIMQGDNDQTISSKNMAEGIKEWTNVLGLNTDPDSTAKIVSSESGANYTYNCKFWKNDCGYVVLESWFAAGGGHSMGYEEPAILKFFGLDTYKDGDRDPELEMCDSTAVCGSMKRTAGMSTNVFLRGKTIVFNGVHADGAAIKIVTISGKVVYNGSFNVSSANASLSVPVSSLHAGCYVAMVEFHEGNKQVMSSKFHFVLMN